MSINLNLSSLKNYFADEVIYVQWHTDVGLMLDYLIQPVVIMFYPQIFMSVEAVACSNVIFALI